MSDFNKWRCKECRAEFLSHEMLRADSPFDPTDTLYACPHCKTTEQPDELCEEPGCNMHATCGTPFGQVEYKRHCHLHPPIPAILADQGLVMESKTSPVLVGQVCQRCKIIKTIASGEVSASMSGIEYYPTCTCQSERKCSRCTHWGKDEQTFRHCSCPAMHYGYHTDESKIGHDHIMVEYDEEWGMYTGPDFGCVHFETPNTSDQTAKGSQP